MTNLKAWLFILGVGNTESTLANALQYKFKKNLSDIKGLRPGIVHRIDKDTSGSLLWQKIIYHMLFG